ncbi:MAG: polysaccharide biosynthesis tyrosine autokinase, partial [Dethiobacteria bacterium]
EIILSRRILKVVADDEMIPYNADQIRNKLQVEGVGGTELIEIKASDTDAVLASYMANMVSRIFMDEIDQVISDANVNILDDAPVPTNPSNPLADRNMIIAAMIGLIAAVGLVFVIDYADQTIKESEEAEKLLGLPVVGVITKVDGKTLNGRNEFTVSGRSPAAEAFRTIRTNIQFASVDKPVKVILVTGATPGSGKSTVAANLAITFAQGGGAVLLVDADLRRPAQQRFFELDSEPGLSNLVYNRDLGLAEVVQESGRDNLTVITSGPIPPYPAEMLSSQRMRGLVESMAGQFEYVIFDSPPVLAVTDAVVLSNLVDGTLIVLDYGRIKRDEALHALKQLQMVQANVIGSVLNAVPQSQGGYGSYKNYYGLDEKKTGKGKKEKPLKAAGS